MRCLTLPVLLFCFLRHSSLVEASVSATAAGTTVAGGLFHTCGIVEDFSLRCFGGGSSDAVLQIAPLPAIENGFGNFGQLGVGHNRTLGDEDGEMGDFLPAVDLGDNTVHGVAAGQSHTCVLLTSGSVACWGYNGFGQLGLENTVDRGLSPDDMGDGLALVDLGTGRTATQISCSQYGTCAVLDNGSLKCWGRNNNGMLGLGDTDDRGGSVGDMGDNLPAIDLGTGNTAVAVSQGQYHTCAILDNGGLKCWGGKNDTGFNFGQLGQGNTFDIGGSPGQMGDNLPEVDLGTGRTVVALATGWWHTCVILDNQQLHCFGRNFDGQLGLGDDVDRGAAPEDMGDNMEAVNLGVGRSPISVATGRWHTCVLMDDQELKCFGANTSDDLGAGQLGLEDDHNRGKTFGTTGDGLETVDLGPGRVNGWVFAAFDHSCILFEDASLKCWGLNKSGQLGIEDTVDRGDKAYSMGSNLPVTSTGMRFACPPTVSFDVDAAVEEEGDGGLSTEMQIVVSLVGSTGGFFVLGAFCLFCRRRLENRAEVYARKSVPDAVGFQGGEDGGGAPEVEIGNGVVKSREAAVADAAPTYPIRKKLEQSQSLAAHPPAAHPAYDSPTMLHEQSSRTSVMSDEGGEVGMAAAGTAGLVVAGGITVGWNVIGVVAEHLPWIGVAYHILNEIADIVDTKSAMQGNKQKIRSWALSLQDVILQMGRQMQTKPAVNANALANMSKDVVSSLQDLVDAVSRYNAKGALAQYTSSRSCQKAVDAADTALRGALAKLSVGQGAELISMVGRLEGAGIVLDEKLDMIIEHLRKQEEKAKKLELRLAEYSESMAEVLGQFAHTDIVSAAGKGQTGKTVAQLGKEKLDKLQISKEAVSYPSNLPFASGAYSEVYQVIHEGVIKAAKKTNLARLGVGGRNDVNRVFKRFVKELYILSQMHSDRVVSVYGAIASPIELTLVMEFVEKGSIRTILDDEKERMTLTPARQHGLLMDTAAGMTYLYKNGVAHRDLKSANCLVTHDWRVKITDFGLSDTTDAISTGTESNVYTTFRGGTMVYMAPELLPGEPGKEVPSELSDVYSFGVVVWDVVCGAGETPWADVGIHDLPLMLKAGKRLGIPADCEYFYRELMLNCWRHDPNRRPKFEHILNSITTEAATVFSTTPKLPQLTETPLEQARTERPGLQLGIFDSAPTRLVKISSPEDRLGTGSSDKEPSAPLATATTTGAKSHAELLEMGPVLRRVSSF